MCSPAIVPQLFLFLFTPNIFSTYIISFHDNIPLLHDQPTIKNLCHCISVNNICRKLLLRFFQLLFQTIVNINKQLFMLNEFKKSTWCSISRNVKSCHLDKVIVAYDHICNYYNLVRSIGAEYHIIFITTYEI